MLIIIFLQIPLAMNPLNYSIQVIVMMNQWIEVVNKLANDNQVFKVKFYEATYGPYQLRKIILHIKFILI